MWHKLLSPSQDTEATLTSLSLCCWCNSQSHPTLTSARISHSKHLFVTSLAARRLAQFCRLSTSSANSGPSASNACEFWWDTACCMLSCVGQQCLLLLS